MTAHRVLPERADVVIIGAGLAGLAAAKVVHGAGRDVVIVEASGDVGGEQHLKAAVETEAVDHVGTHAAAARVGSRESTDAARRRRFGSLHPPASITTYW